MFEPLTASPFADPTDLFRSVAGGPTDRNYRQFFIAQLTGKTLVGGVWLYTWEEQTFDRATSLHSNANPRRSGGVFSGVLRHPAVELNNADIPIGIVAGSGSGSGQGGTYVFMRQKGIVNGQTYYEFTFPLETSCPATGRGAALHAVIPNEGALALSTLDGVTLPRAGKYLVWGTATFHGRVTSTQAGIMLAQVCERVAGGGRVFGELLEVTIPPGSGHYGGFFTETRSFTSVINAPEDNFQLGWLVARSPMTVGAWDISFIGNFGATTLQPRGEGTDIGWELLCETPSIGSGSGSVPCTPIYGWGGAGWYCIIVGEFCTPAELLDADECDASIIICSGPFVDEAGAIAACSGSGSGSGSGSTPPGTLSCCPAYEPSPGVGATSCTATVTGGASSGACHIPGGAMAFYSFTTGGALAQSDTTPLGFSYQLQCLDGAWTAILSFPEGGGGDTGVLVSEDCTFAGISRTYTFVYPGGVTCGPFTLTITFTLT